MATDVNDAGKKSKKPAAKSRRIAASLRIKKKRKAKPASKK